MVVVHNWKDLIESQDVLFFCDNLGAVHSFAGGVSNARDLQVLVSISHVLFNMCRMRWWIEWVPSEANCSDGLSRLGARDLWAVEHLSLIHI